MPGLPPLFPSDRDAKRAALLAAVERIRPVVESHIDETEEGRTLAPAVVEALHDSGLNRLKAPIEVGGAEADPMLQMEVIEALALIDPAASWCMLISSAVAGSALSRLHGDAVEQILSSGRFPFMAGSLRPGGEARVVDGGVRVTGRWAWGSGVPHADWVQVPVVCPERKTVLSAVVPTSEITIHDNWHVMGMKGTGSNDYELDDVFVPELFAPDLLREGPLRGGALYRMGLPGYVVNEHGAFAYALGRRVIELATAYGVAKRRGYADATTIADRDVFQRTVARATLRMNACELLMVEAVERLFAEAEAGLPTPAMQAEARAAAVYCTDEALDVATALLRYAGGGAVMLDNQIQRCVRDLLTVQSHLVVSDSSYEIWGRILLGMSDEAPLR